MLGWGAVLGGDPEKHIKQGKAYHADLSPAFSELLEIYLVILLFLYREGDNFTNDFLKMYKSLTRDTLYLVSRASLVSAVSLKKSA